MNEKTGKFKGFAFALVLEHVQREILKWNNIRKQNYCYGRCDFYKTERYKKFAKIF